MNSAAWRVLIVDDEPLAREGLQARLEPLTDFAVVDAVGTGRAALAAIDRWDPDLLLLDIELPAGGGFDVMDAIAGAARPEVVFVTAYEQHALRAFGTRAIGYLVKPIDGDRFTATMDRVRARLRMQRESAVGRDVAALMATAGMAPPGANANRLRVRDGRRTIFLEPQEVDWIAADGDYVRIHAGRTSFLCRDTIARLETTLASSAFVRIHRSAIVNLARIRQVSTHEKDLRVLMRDGTRLRASRTHAERLRVALGM